MTLAHPSPPPPTAQPVLVVTGLSGAGMSTALRSLQDLGYEAVDNLRLSLLLPLLEQAQEHPLAVVIDSRTHDFNPTRLLTILDEIRQCPDLKPRLLFMEAADEILQRRYTETRRPHPMAPDRTVLDGILRERDLFRPVRAAADEVIDTTDLSVHDARRLLTMMFALNDGPRLKLVVTSFSFRNGVPRESDMVFDVRFLDNPHWQADLRPLTGLDPPVQAHIRKDPDFSAFFANLTGLLAPLLPRYLQEGKHYLTIAFGCTGGKHRSVFLAHALAIWLKERGYSVVEAHRELDRRGGGQTGESLPGEAKGS